MSQDGFEPSTLALKGRYSTAELLAHYPIDRKDRAGKIFKIHPQSVHVNSRLFFPEFLTVRIVRL